MSNKYLKLYSSDESKAIDALAIEKLSLAPLELMSRAAKFAFNTMLECWPSLRSVPFFRVREIMQAMLFYWLGSHKIMELKSNLSWLVIFLRYPEVLGRPTISWNGSA
ncbi:MAG: hypothetical protein Ct9H90mP27_3330 [Gammaproteobacteria bacterium]|nr:MAG: hypothetical protein Ct9H90mP27_3330 [Gammaproteobacteria bacterium]